MNADKPGILISDLGARGDGVTLNTRSIQRAIDTGAEQGGATVIVSRGTYLSGALFLKPGVNLHLEKGAVLLGSDRIEDYPWLPSRVEGVSQNYYAALINADHCDDFLISGSGKIDGNGRTFWQAFWETREQNPECTNLEVARPRLIYISHSKNISIEGLQLQNSGFWTTHLYRCQNIRLTRLHIFSPREPLRAPSTDGIDLDVCRDVHIDKCQISVNDDAICIKGGKGINADTLPENGPTENVLIENCSFGWNHAVLTVGSEAIACRDIRMRDCEVKGAWIVFRCKIRPDTPQDFRNISLENIRGHAHTFLMIRDWTQFYDDGGAATLPHSRVRNLCFQNIDFSCKEFRVIDCKEETQLSDFKFFNMRIACEEAGSKAAQIDRVEEEGLHLTRQPYKGRQGKIDEL